MGAACAVRRRGAGCRLRRTYHPAAAPPASEPTSCPNSGAGFTGVARRSAGPAFAA